METTATTAAATIAIEFNAFLPPRATYFRASDVSPELATREDGSLVIRCCNGESYRASWGASWCRTRLVHQSENLVILFVKWSNKHAFGAQEYYFVRDPKKGWRRTNKTGARKYLQAVGQ